MALIAQGIVSSRSATAGLPTAGGGIVPGRYIVVLNDDVDAEHELDDIERDEGLWAELVYSHALSGFSASLSQAQVAALLADPRVNNVVPDRVVHIADTTPTGIDRIDAEGSSPPGGGDYSGVRVAVLDTGIDPAQPYLNVDPSCSFSSQGPSSNDGHGHGTHVSGTIGAIAGNSLAVKGVAPGASLCAVKVLDDAGSGTWSQIIAGIDFVTATRTDGDPSNDIEVANMSLGGCAVVSFIFCLAQPPPNNDTCGLDGATVNDPLHQAICESIKAGVVYSVAAGNDDSRALYFVPAAYPEAVTVGAVADYNGQGGGGAPTTCANYGPDDSFATFSNYNQSGDDVVDVVAPGVCILSTAPGGGLATMSGTSMATPHVAGAVAKLIGDGDLSVGPSSDPLAARNAAMAALNTKPRTDPNCGYAPDSAGHTGGPVLYVGQPDTNCGGSSGPGPTPTPTPAPPPECTPGGNDGFEVGPVNTNDIPCWTVVDQAGGAGSWCNQTGTALPQGSCSGSSTSVAAPPEALQAAMTNQTGGGSHLLYRCGFLASGNISFQLYIHNEWSAFYSPASLDYTVPQNQQFRADLVTAAGIAADPFTVAPSDVLLNIYQTQPGDPLVSGYGLVTADAGAHVGQEVCLRFAEADNQYYIHAGVDDIIVDLSADSVPTPLDITTTSLPDGQLGQGYSQSLQATGGTTPYTWSVASGSLPPGLSLNSSTGVISGTPTTAGTASFTVQVTDSSSPAQTDTRALSITVAPAPPTTVTLAVTDGYDEKNEATLSEEGKVDVVQAVDSDRWETEAGFFTSYDFDNVTIPAEATITSAVVYVVHYEELEFTQDTGTLEWKLGSGWGPGQGTVWKSTDAPLHFEEQNETEDSWDVTNVVTPQRANEIQLIAENNDPEGKKTLANQVYVVVEWTTGPPNNPPVADGQSVTTAEDMPKAITLTGSDPDGDPLSFSVVNGPSHGSLSGTAPNVTYTPNSDYNGPDSFTFKVNDGTVDSTPATVSITVTPVNDPPTCSGASVTSSEGTTSAPFSLNCSDVDGDPLTCSIVTPGSKGTLNITNCSSAMYTSTSGTGVDTVTYEAEDPSLANSNTSTVSVTINPVNSPPSLTGIPDISFPEEGSDSSIGLDLFYSDAETAAANASFSVTTCPVELTCSIDAVSHVLTVSGDLNFNGTVNVTVQATDRGDPDNCTPGPGCAAPLSASDTLQVTVTPVNDLPVANGQSVTAAEDTAKAITLTGSDVDGDPLTFTVVMGPGHGSLSGTPPNLTYTPNSDYNGPDSFTFVVNDGSVDSIPATVSITVTPVNDPPVAYGQSVDSVEDTARAITMTGSDPDGDPLSFSVVNGPSHGSLNGTPPNVTYTPSANFNGSDSFTFVVYDGTVFSASATVSVTITPVNDQPVADSQSVTTSEGTPVAITLTGSDVDGDPLTFSVVTGPANGSLSGTPPNLTYTPAPGFTGSDTFSYTVSDGSLSDSGTVSVTVNPDVLVGEGIKLSKNPDFSTEDSVFSWGETMYILVWSDQLDFNNIKEARWQLEGAEQPLTNNFDGTYTSQVLIDDDVKQLSPGEVVQSKIQIQMEDESGYQVEIEVPVTLVRPPSTGSPPSD